MSSLSHKIKCFNWTKSEQTKNDNAKIKQTNIEALSLSHKQTPDTHTTTILVWAYWNRQVARRCTSQYSSINVCGGGGRWIDSNICRRRKKLLWTTVCKLSTEHQTGNDVKHLILCVEWWKKTFFISVFLTDARRSASSSLIKESESQRVHYMCVCRPHWRTTLSSDAQWPRAGGEPRHPFAALSQWHNKTEAWLRIQQSEEKRSSVEQPRTHLESSTMAW